jgi:hypothetical protein
MTQALAPVTLAIAMFRIIPRVAGEFEHEPVALLDAGIEADGADARVSTGIVSDGDGQTTAQGLASVALVESQLFQVVTDSHPGDDASAGELVPERSIAVSDRGGASLLERHP